VEVSDEALGVTPGRTASSADLGGSSKYSNENFEDWSVVFRGTEEFCGSCWFRGTEEFCGSCWFRGTEEFCGSCWFRGTVVEKVERMEEGEEEERMKEEVWTKRENCIEGEERFI